MKPCPITGCTATCRDDQVMCSTHWRLVPDPLQKTIWRLWHDGKPREGHMEAVLSAIAQVNEKLRVRAQSPRTALNPAAAWPFPEKKTPEVTAPGAKKGDIQEEGGGPPAKHDSAPDPDRTQ